MLGKSKNLGRKKLPKTLDVLELRYVCFTNTNTLIKLIYDYDHTFDCHSFKYYECTKIMIFFFLDTKFLKQVIHLLIYL